MAADRLDEVLDAAYDCLTRYGARRTTMDDIATTMGVSRSAVYQYVRGKDDAFRQLSARLHSQALRQAREAATAEGTSYATRVRGVLAVKLDLVRRLTGDSPHTAELLDDKARLCGDLCGTFTAGLRQLLVGLFASAGTTAAAGPEDAADVCLALVAGLEATPDGERLLGPATDALLTGLLDASAESGPAESAFPGGGRGATMPG
ncbi:TetR family transcriptional regulator [Streptomyces sp. WAC 01325]|uniref:TetR/AcrR family transcriptional regulator n=1 Tax=Streptomyces sp. WAC 01325 TaxID=2203202 RepID=UPI000F893DEE|nr:TetR/AcrR family transcriptional regulator [Streptomyces sp. WAC 01325]RSN13807.1 TetR family transcriptional regulator [Streptomyces sp. WAC 01325]